MKKYYYIVYEFGSERSSKATPLSDLIDMRPFEWLVNTVERGQVIRIVYSEEITEQEYFEYAEKINLMF